MACLSIVTCSHPLIRFSTRISAARSRQSEPATLSALKWPILDSGPSWTNPALRRLRPTEADEATSHLKTFR